MKNIVSMRGGAIILIILIMLALSIFGVLAMTTAHSDLMLSRKGATWVQRYYLLDTMGQNCLSEANEIVKSQGFASLTDAGWKIDGDTADITLVLEESETKVGNKLLKNRKQALNIVIKRNSKGFEIQSYKQQQEHFTDGNDESNVWLPN